MQMQKVVVIGGGVLGSQIAFQCAYKGFQVTIYVRSQESIGRARPKLQGLRDTYLQELTAAKAAGGPLSRGLLPDGKTTGSVDYDALIGAVGKAEQTLQFCTSLGQAAAGADIVIEALSENPAEKKEFYAKLQQYLPEKTILVTNSSTLLPSMLADATGRPEKFLALHFANQIWRQNTAEIMGHDRTDPAAFEAVAAFAQQIGMVPLRLKKEKAGYILNSMLVPFLMSGQALLADGIADVETIDLTWRLATGAPMGPFQILDIVGISTAYNILQNYPDTTADPTCLHARLAKMLKEDYLDKGKTGVAAGEGFYSYRPKQAT